MNEINFFEDNKKKIDINLDNFDFKYKAYILPAVLILVFVIFIILNITTNHKISNLNNQVANLNNQITNYEAANADAEKILSEDEEIKLKQYSLNLIESLDDVADVSTEALNQIKTAIPSSLFLSSLDMNDGELVITGYAKSTNTIAKFQNNLSKSELFSDVFVSDITNELGSYSFTLTAKVRS